MAEYLKRRCLDIELMIKNDYNFMIGIKSIAIALSVITFACVPVKANVEMDKWMEMFQTLLTMVKLMIALS